MICHFVGTLVMDSKILPVPPLAKEGTPMPPLRKGAARSARGFRGARASKKAFASKLTLSFLLVFWIDAWTPVALAQGCAMCQTVMPHADEPIARGMFWCVLLLLTAPFAISAVIGGWLWYHYRGAALRQRQEHA